MTLRLEVGCGQRKPFAWFLRAARRHPSFRFERVGESAIAALEFSSWRDLAPYFFEVCHRRYARVFRNGELVDHETALDAIAAARGFTRYNAPLPADPNGEAPMTARLMRDVLKPAARCPSCGQERPQ